MKNTEQINSKIKTYIAAIRDRKKVLIRATIFLVVVLGLKLARGVVSKGFYGYALQHSDFFARYVLIALLPLFIFGCWERITNKEFKKDSVVSTIIAGFLAVLLLIFPSHYALAFGQNAWLYGELALDWLREFALFIAFFGRPFVKKFRYEIVLMIFLMFFLEAAEIITEKYWKFSSIIILRALEVVMPFLRMPFEVNANTYLISLNNFRIMIGAPCAGLQSLAAFTLLYSFTILLLRKRAVRYSGTAAVLWYLIGFVTVYILNCLRVLLILLVGALYDPELAINAFHSAIGSIIFLLFFVVFIRVSLPRIMQKPIGSSPEEKSDKQAKK